MYINSSWLVLIIISTVLGLATQAYINSTFRKWSKVGLRGGMTGASVAAQVLAANGIDVDNTAIAPLHVKALTTSPPTTGEAMPVATRTSEGISEK